MRWACCLLLMLPAGSSGDGAAAYVAGRFEEAAELWLEREGALGNDASPELLYNISLAALGAGRATLAEAAAEKAAARGGEAFIPLRDFLMGNVAFARCEKNQVLALRVEAGPVAFDAAIADAESAIRWWRRAALSREDWPQARRNVERGLIKLRELEKEREDRTRKRSDRPRNQQPPQRRPQGQSDPVRPGRQVRRNRVLTAQLKELSSEQVSQLLHKLTEKQTEKGQLRRRRQQALRVPGVRDW